MGNCCKVEFQTKHLIFDDAKPRQFRKLQWTNNVWLFFAYRLFMFAYPIGWLIYAYARGRFDPFNSPFWQLLSNWCEVVMNIYFLIAFLVSIYAIAVRNSNDDTGNVRWFHKLNWLMYIVGANSAFVVSVFYWALLAPGRSIETNFRPITVHLHLINSVLFIIDTFMIAFPTYFLQFWYTNLYGVVYVIFMLIMHWTGVNSAIYSTVDWANNPGLAAGYSVLAAIVLPIITHSILFGLYHLRAFIARRCGVISDQSNNSDAAPSAPPMEEIEMGRTNPAFENPAK